MNDRYTPHPIHQVIPTLMITLALIIFVVFPGWATGLFFVAITIMGVGTSLWISWAGKTREEAEYWWNIGYDIEALRRSSPDIWVALGFKEPPQSVYLRKEVTGEEGRSPIYEEEKHTFNLTPGEMNYLANEVLSGKKTLAETEWVGTPIGSTRIRNTKHQMLKAGLISKTHASAATQGFIPTEDGIEYFKEYASDWAIEMYENSKPNVMKSNNDNGHA